MAAVFSEAERTVARRGSQLLESGAVAVVGVRPKPAAVLFEMRCIPGTLRTAAKALAQRKDITFVYTTTGTGDCVAEIMTDPVHMADVLSDELPPPLASGIQRATRCCDTSAPSGVAAGDPQRGPCRGAPITAHPGFGHPEAQKELSRQDTEIVEALCADGRMSFEALGRRVGCRRPQPDDAQNGSLPTTVSICAW